MDGSGLKNSLSKRILNRFFLNSNNDGFTIWQGYGKVVRINFLDFSEFTDLLCALPHHVFCTEDRDPFLQGQSFPVLSVVLSWQKPHRIGDTSLE